MTTRPLTRLPMAAIIALGLLALSASALALQRSWHADRMPLPAPALEGNGASTAAPATPTSAPRDSAPASRPAGATAAPTAQSAATSAAERPTAPSAAATQHSSPVPPPTHQTGPALADPGSPGTTSEGAPASEPNSATPPHGIDLGH